MKGYSIDRCFKLPRYPNKNRPSNKRFVVLAGSDLVAKSKIENMGLSLEKFNHLCAFFGKNETSQENTSMEVLDTPSATSIACTFCLTSFFNKDAWIILIVALPITCVTFFFIFTIFVISKVTPKRSPFLMKVR